MFFEIICSFFDAVILYIYLRKILGQRKESVTKILYAGIFILIEVLLFVLMAFFDASHNNFRVYITIGASLITTFSLTLMHESTLRHRLFATISFQVYATLAEILVYVLFSLLPAEISDPLLSNDYDGLVCSKIVLFLFMNITILLWQRKRKAYTAQYTILVLIMPVLSLVLLTTIPIQNSTSSAQLVLSLTGMTGILIANVANYFLLNNILKVNELNLAKAQQERQLEYQANKYQQISTVYRESRSLIHDMKKHFFYISNCVETKDYDKITPYLDTAIKNIEQTHNRVNTGNLVIDAFVSNHMTIAEHENIEFRNDIQIANANVDIEDYDFSIILGNLLDNALNACRWIQVPAPRQIAVQIFTTNLELVIHISNTVSKHSPEKERIKNDSLYHGFGTMNIETIVKKYMGTYTHYMEKDSYHSIIAIPCHIS